MKDKIVITFSLKCLWAYADETALLIVLTNLLAGNFT